MSNQITSLSIKNLAEAKRLTATTNTPGVEISAFTGSALFVLNASATEGAGQTADFKLQDCDTLNGTYTDTGISFAQVTNARAAFQQVLASVDGLRRFVRVAAVLGGTSPAVTYSVAVVGKANF